MYTRCFANSSDFVSRFCLIGGYNSFTSNTTNLCWDLFFICLNQLIISAEFFHWFSCKLFLSSLFILPKISLLILPISFFAGFIKSVLGLFTKFSLWSLSVIKHSLVLLVSILFKTPLSFAYVFPCSLICFEMFLIVFLCCCCYGAIQRMGVIFLLDFINIRCFVDRDVHFVCSRYSFNILIQFFLKVASELVIKRMRWKTIFSNNEHEGKESEVKKQYGLKSPYCPPVVKALSAFEKDLCRV